MGSAWQLGRDAALIQSMKIKDASAEQSKKTGGMIALYRSRTRAIKGAITNRRLGRWILGGTS